MIVIDASVAVKWTVQENLHGEAVALADGQEAMAAPDLVLLETHNVMRRKLKQGQISDQQLQRVIEELPAIFDLLVPVSGFVAHAATLSTLLDHPIYDCLYLACALDFGATLITADQHFARKVFDSKFRASVEGLNSSTTSKLAQKRQQETVEGRALNLWRVFERTLSYVRTQVEKPVGSSGATVVTSHDVQPAFDSPAYLRLHRFVAALPPLQKARLLAIAWHGRPYTGNNWSEVLDRAEQQVARSEPRLVEYIVSTFHTLDAGLEQLRSMSEHQS